MATHMRRRAIWIQLRQNRARAGSLPSIWTKTACACVVPDDHRGERGTPAVATGPILRIAAPGQAEHLLTEHARANPRRRPKRPPSSPSAHRKRGANGLLPRKTSSEVAGKEYDECSSRRNRRVSGESRLKTPSRRCCGRTHESNFALSANGDKPATSSFGVFGTNSDGSFVH